MKRLTAVATLGARVLAATLLCGNALAGPVILGGDDLNDHGNRSGTANLLGWLYIQNALQNLVGSVTLPGNNGRIVVLGSAPSMAMSGNGCAAAFWPGQSIGRQVDCIDTATGINSFFLQLAGGAPGPAVIVIPGNQVGNALDTAEEAALLANAPALASYVAAGGGLLSHSGQYTWLTTLIPGIVLNQNCDANTATLTPAGAGAFPLVTNTDIRAGPCHNTFSGNFGSLQVLAVDSQNRPLLLGGGAGTVIAPQPLGPTDIPTLSEWALLLLASLLAATAALRLRRR